MGATKEELEAVLRDAEERQAARFRGRCYVVFLVLLVAGIVAWTTHTMKREREEAARLVEEQRELHRRSIESQLRVRAMNEGR